MTWKQSLCLLCCEELSVSRDKIYMARVCLRRRGGFVVLNNDISVLIYVSLTSKPWYSEPILITSKLMAKNSLRSQCQSLIFNIWKHFSRVKHVISKKIINYHLIIRGNNFFHSRKLVGGWFLEIIYDAEVKRDYGSFNLLTHDILVRQINYFWFLIRTAIHKSDGNTKPFDVKLCDISDSHTKLHSHQKILKAPMAWKYFRLGLNSQDLCFLDWHHETKSIKPKALLFKQLYWLDWCNVKRTQKFISFIC